MDDARHLLARARLHGQHRPAAALGDEVLLQVLAEARRAREPAQLLGDALPAVAQLGAQLAQARRGVVAQVGAVLLDAAADLLGERGERAVDGVDASSASSGADSACSPSAARAASPPPIVSATALQRLGGEHAAARRVRGGLADVADPAERRLERLVEQRDRLGRQRLAARDLVRVGRRHERARELRAGGGRRRAGEPLDDRRETRARRARAASIE